MDIYDKTVEDLPKPPYATDKEWREEKDLLKEKYRLRDKKLNGKTLTTEEKRRFDYNEKRLGILARKRYERQTQERRDRISEELADAEKILKKFYLFRNKRLIEEWD